MSVQATAYPDALDGPFVPKTTYSSPMDCPCNSVSIMLDGPFVLAMASPSYLESCMIDYIVAAGDLLFCRFLLIYFQRCAAHALDLLLEDWGKQRWMKSMIK